MLWIVIRREITADILSFKFLVGVLIYFSLVVPNLYLLTKGYEDRLKSYQTAIRESEDEIRQVKVYSEFSQNYRLRCHRKPKLLSIFNAGIEKRMGNSVVLAHGYVPAVAEEHGSDNPYLNIFPSIDYTIIFQVVMSLLALLFSYDRISREKEAGTLRLTLSCAVARPTLILGKYIAGMVSLCLPLIASFVAGLLVVQFSPYVSWTGSDWTRILLILLVSILYLSFFFLIGLFLSARTHQPSVTLMLSMYFWIFFVLIIPNLTVLFVEQLNPIRSEELYKTQARAHMNEFQNIVKNYLKNRGIEDLWELANPRGLGSSTGASDYGSGETISVRGIRNERGALLAQEFFGFKENLRTQYTDRIWQIHKEYLDRNQNRQSLLALNISRLSPTPLYANVTAILAETDLKSFWRFMEQTREYRYEWIQYLRDNKIFPSRRWFTTDGSEALLDLSGMPKFKEKGESIENSIQRALPDIMILTILNIICFMGAFISFIRYDVI